MGQKRSSQLLVALEASAVSSRGPGDRIESGQGQVGQRITLQIAPEVFAPDGAPGHRKSQKLHVQGGALLKCSLVP